jgi:hypothetical protein
MPSWCLCWSSWSKAALDRTGCLLLLVPGRKDEGRARWVKGRGMPGYICCACAGTETATQERRKTVVRCSAGSDENNTAPMGCWMMERCALFTRAFATVGTVVGAGHAASRLRRGRK